MMAFASKKNQSIDIASICEVSSIYFGLQLSYRWKRKKKKERKENAKKKEIVS